MAKQYKGSLSLEWFNKQKSVLALGEGSIKSDNDIPAPMINWINKEEALFYEISSEEGKGNVPYWVNRDDIRVKEARPLIFQKAFKAIEKDVEGTIPGTETTYELEEITSEEEALEVSNFLIKGDNLLALNSLKKHFESNPSSAKVKCIYIDPPYNIGAAFEQYDDNLEHSEWLTLTRDRLVLLRDLLADDGSIWVSIDDKEMAYMRVLMDEVFGRDGFIACNVWQKRYSRENREAIGDSHEYILVYSKNPEKFKLFRNKIALGEKQMKLYKNPDNDPKGAWQSISLTAQGFRKNQMYEIVAPSGKKHSPPEGSCWKVIEKNFKNLVDEGRVYFGQDGNGVPRRKLYLSEAEGLVPWTWWPHEEVGHTDEANKEMQTIFGKENVFATPKPERLIQRILHIATTEGDLILDCFGGSGTSFAVAHKMKRNWIGVEIGDHADSHIVPRLKNTLTASKRVGIDDNVNWKGGGSFKYYHLGNSIISVDSDTGKGEFNWTLGKKFIQDSLLLSYDFLLLNDVNLFPAQLFQSESEKPSVGKFSSSNSRQSLFGVALLAEPNENNLTITNEEVKTIYSTLKKQNDFKALVIYTNKGIDIAQETIPADLDIIKVPHAVFAELER